MTWKGDCLSITLPFAFPLPPSPNSIGGHLIHCLGARQWVVVVGGRCLPPLMVVFIVCGGDGIVCVIVVRLSYHSDLERLGTAHCLWKGCS